MSGSRFGFFARASRSGAVLSDFWLGAALALSSVLLLSGGCGRSSEPARVPVVSDSGAPLAVHVDGQGIDVHVRAECEEAPCEAVPSTEVVLHMPGDEVLSVGSDDDGNARFEPGPRSLFDAAEVGVAVVEAQGHEVEVDLMPLIEAQRSRHPDLWKELVAKRAAAQLKLDDAVVFNGRIFRDKSTHPLVQGCSKQGAERCFDGIDNDCDGRYDDVGCGYSSGTLQWTLSWKGSADLDLYVEGPKGSEVSALSPGSAKSELWLERSCRGRVDGKNDCPKGNVENAIAAGAPTSGTYFARVEVADPKAHAGPIAARLSGRIGHETWYTDVELAPFHGVEYRLAYPVGTDTDGDAVLDEHDACPEVKGCWFDDLEYRGCGDRDGDSIPDALDECPDKTGLFRVEDGLNGCPMIFGDAWVTNQGIQIQKRIEFDTNRATLRPESARLIRDIAEAINKRPESVERMAIDGHTDERGSDDDNYALSYRRSRSVASALVDAGVPREVLLARGFGETKPLDEEKSPDAYQRNRRVEFVLLRPPPRSSECW